MGFWTVPGDVPWLVTVVTGPRGVLGLHMICRVLGHCCLRMRGIELPPLVIEDRSLMLPFNPSPGHWAQSVNAPPQVGVEHLLKMVDKSDIS